MSELKRGAILTYGTIILTNITGILLTPLIINKLGDAEYGLYTLIGALVGYISVLDFGLNNTIVRFVAKYRVKGDKIGEENFLAISMVIYAIISVIIIVVGLTLFFKLDLVFADSLKPEELRVAKQMFKILIFNLAVTLPGGAFTAICSGYEHFVFPRFINISRHILRSMLVVGLLFTGGGAIGIVLIDTILNIVVISINGYYVFKKLSVTFSFHSFQASLFKEIISYSIWIFVFALVGQFQWKVGQLILGTIKNTTVVAVYAVGIMLGSYYGTFSTAISGVLLPRATRMAVQNASSLELTRMMSKVGRISLLVLLLIFSEFVLFGKQFVLLWVGVNYLEAWLISIIIMATYTIPLVQAFANLLLEAKGKYAFKSLVYLVLVCFGALVGALLAPKYGAIGMVIGSSIGWMISILIMNVYYHKILGLYIPLFYKELLRLILPSFIAVLIIGYLIALLPGVGWLNLLLKSTLYATVYVAVMYFFGMNLSEKNLFVNYLPNLKRNRC